MTRMAAILLALALVVVACGDDDSGAVSQAGGDNSELISNLTQKIVADSPNDSDFQFDDAQAACFVKGLVDNLGADRMGEALQMEFDEFMVQASAQERSDVVDMMLRCADFGQVLAQEFASSISQDSSNCLADAFVGSDVFRTALADSFGENAANPFDDPELAVELLPIMLECLSAEELIQIGSDS